MNKIRIHQTTLTLTLLLVLSAIHAPVRAAYTLFGNPYSTNTSTTNINVASGGTNNQPGHIVFIPMPKNPTPGDIAKNGLQNLAANFTPYFGATTGVMSGVLINSLLIAYLSRKFTPTPTFQLTNQTTNGYTTDMASLDSSQKPTETFADVAGAAQAKEALQDVKEYLANPEQYTRLGAKKPKGVLLVGPPGNGKTLLARALAGETNCNFISVKTADIQNIWISSGAQNIKNLFAEARKKSPCIIFFDEIDAIGGKRSNYDSDSTQEHNKNVTELLAQIDGFDTGKDQIIIIGATNHAQNLDPALKRRFTQEIQVPNPTQQDRREILAIHAKNKTFAADVDLDAVSRSTIGFSGSDLANLLDHAAVLATKAKKDAIGMTDILEAWQNKILGGAINKTMDLTQDDLEKTAYHEAGHALVTLLNPEILDPLYMVTIEPRGGTLGVCATIPDREKYAQSKPELLAIITRCMGGRAAEHVQFKQQYTGVSNDIEKASDIARTMIQTYGMSDLGPVQWGASYTHSPAFQEKIDTQVQAMLENGYEQACTLLEQNKDKLDKLAGELLAKKTLQAAEIYELLGITPRTCNQLELGAPSITQEPELEPAGSAEPGEAAFTV